MKEVYFQNDGILDPVSITTFGVNAKDNDNPIGYFGTGLKYAIAILLRHKQSILIKSGDAEYRFTVKNETVRNKDFDVVCMNDTPLGFTTELGKEWELWQAFRELYCNTLDEKGVITNKLIEHSENQTTIIVDGDLFHECFLNKGDVILDLPIYLATERCDFHKNKSNHIYYKGIRIYDLRHPSFMTYNIHYGLDISEDRSAKYVFQIRNKIATLIVTCEDRQLIKEILTCGNNYFEWELDYADDPLRKPSETFLDVASQLRLNPKAHHSIQKVLHAHRRIPEPLDAELTHIQNVMLDRAIKFCRQIGYPVDKYRIIASADLKSGIMGLAENNTIYLSVDAFGIGTKYLASTMIEEYLHLHTGYGDMTRELQNHLFNDIVSLGEQLLGEPV